MDTVECHHLHMEMRDFFETLNLTIEKEFPLLLVEKEALNKAEKEEKIVSTFPKLKLAYLSVSFTHMCCKFELNQENHYGTVTRGICLSEEQMVESVSH